MILGVGAEFGEVLLYGKLALGKTSSRADPARLLRRPPQPPGSERRCTKLQCAVGARNRQIAQQRRPRAYSAPFPTHFLIG
jgi:hypothetical protein